MEKYKLIIVEQDEKSGKELSKLITRDERFEVEKIYTDASDAIEYLKYNKIDVVITELVLKGIDGFEFIENMKKLNLDSSTKVIVASHLSGDGFVQRCFNLGVDYYIIKPFSTSVLIDRICDLVVKNDVENKNKVQIISNNPIKVDINNNKNKQLEMKITNIFITVGIPAHIKGYQFLREAIKMAIDNPEIINSITKKLYPSIAERFETSASKVERAIRHAIEVAWNRGKIENINNLFGIKVYGNNEKPTNGEFIALVADKMLIEGA